MYTYPNDQNGRCPHKSPVSKSGKPAAPRRSTYRHGDLQRALLEAGVALAQEGGPAAVVLREATRRVGVVPNAAYRHFKGHAALFEAVRAEGLARLAEAMQREMALVRGADAASHARGLLSAVGRGYLGFAQQETGLFRTAFASGPYDVGRAAGLGGAAQPNAIDAATPAVPRATADSVRANPFLLLKSALDAMAEAGVLSPAQRAGAEFLAWSAVHGMAFLLIEGPLRHAGQAERTGLAERLLGMVDLGLAKPA